MASITIINIGDELLIGQVTNTNAASMGQLLTQQGLTVEKVVTVGDDGEAIAAALRAAMAQTDITILTGGLGPTKDDITKKTLLQVFGGTLQENAEQLAIIEGLFAKRGYPMTPVNRQQSLTPTSCTTIPNPSGTAPAMWFEKEGRVAVSLPGVPHEAMALMRNEIVPRIMARFHAHAILTKNVLVQGIGESFLSDLIEPWELSLPAHMALAYLPQAGMTKLRLTARGHDRLALQQEVDERVRALYPIAGKYIVGEDCESLAELVDRTFKQHGITLATAESCTGGNLARLLTALPGCSQYYKGGAVCYCDQAKHTMLGVSEETLRTHTAVSGETAREMADGIRVRLGSDYAVATTGIAGPDGGTPTQPVGTVWIGIATPRGTQATLCHFGGNDRQRVIERATNEAFHLLMDATR